MIPPSGFTLKAPIYNPEKLICVGMNYVDHCTEQNIPVPEEPVIFNKFSSSITEPNGPVIKPDLTDVSVQLDIIKMMLLVFLCINEKNCCGFCFQITL